MCLETGASSRQLAVVARPSYSQAVRSRPGKEEHRPKFCADAGAGNSIITTHRTVAVLRPGTPHPPAALLSEIPFYREAQPRHPRAHHHGFAPRTKHTISPSASHIFFYDHYYHDLPPTRRTAFDSSNRLAAESLRSTRRLCSALLLTYLSLVSVPVFDFPSILFFDCPSIRRSSSIIEHERERDKQDVPPTSRRSTLRPSQFLVLSRQTTSPSISSVVWSPAFKSALPFFRRSQNSWLSIHRGPSLRTNKPFISHFLCFPPVHQSVAHLCKTFGPPRALPKPFRAF
ncbi:hypothetical protein HYFRA_00010257 [Hymenoscyphus fraxineus]|uniref:Uncharacterized protein n=1 Tax=Hymenoscyphus fraxineus TaxID=746836 RepID=A0A9N9KWY6_9HELO|nr:hypothetical protein HYFRA_00010257 [Hymenoscyphus fraxineus]